MDEGSSLFPLCDLHNPQMDSAGESCLKVLPGSSSLPSFNPFINGNSTSSCLCLALNGISHYYFLHLFTFLNSSNQGMLTALRPRALQFLIHRTSPDSCDNSEASAGLFLNLEKQNTFTVLS